MDLRTTQIVDALDPTGVEILLELVSSPATEAELLNRLGVVSQPNANRKLDRLERLGLVTREAGKPHAPGRLWTLVHPAETEALLGTLFDLGEAIDAADQAKRKAARTKLRLARAARLGIREAGSEGAGS